MIKDAFYFPHDANARRDPKLVRLRIKAGWKAIGLYWALIEILREQPTYSLAESDDLIPLLCLEMNIEDDEAKTFIALLDKLALIDRDEGDIFSPSLIRRMKEIDGRRSVMSDLAKHRWEKQMRLAHAGRMQEGDATRITEGDAQAMHKGKESKGKQSKEKKGREAIPIDAKMVFEYMKELRSDLADQKLKQEALAFFDHHAQRNWIPKGASKQMSDWRAAVRTWFRKAIEFAKLPPAPDMVQCPKGREKMLRSRYAAHAATCQKGDEKS